jgi:hypothetical protein
MRRRPPLGPLTPWPPRFYLLRSAAYLGIFLVIVVALALVGASAPAIVIVALLAFVAIASYLVRHVIQHRP